MSQRTICRIVTFSALALVSAIIAFAQGATPAATPAEGPAVTPGATASEVQAARPAEAQTAREVVDAPRRAENGWGVAQAVLSSGSSGHKLLVVTLDRPNRRQSCRVQSFTDDKLVCSRAVGGARTYPRGQIAALILPGSDVPTRWVLVGLNGGLGTAIWATVVLAAACPACAAATAFAALVCFCFAGAVASTDDVPDRLLYLAPDRKQSHKLGYIEPFTQR